jgi:hypothetical protein
VDHAALRTYLEDHLTGARTVIELVEHRLDRGAGPDYLAQFLEEIRSERQVLQGLADAVGDPAGPAKQAAGWVAEKVGRVKLALDEVLAEGLRDLLELELCTTGVEGKRRLYRSLQAMAGDPLLAEVDVDGLLALADRQAEELERHRLAAAIAALSGGRGAG